jgi:hypothetical protein
MTGPYGRQARQRDVAVALAAALEARQTLPAADGEDAVVHVEHSGNRAWWMSGANCSTCTPLLLVRMRGRVERLQALAVIAGRGRAS